MSELQLIRIAKGKKTVIETGNRKKLNDRLKQLRKATRNGVSGRGGKKYRVTYLIENVE